MKVYNAMDLMKSKGGRKKKERTYDVTQPLQFIPNSEKDMEWAAWNMDWLEWNGLKQINDNARRLLKNYKLAEGTIDKSDYIVEDNNEMRDIVDELASDTEIAAMELKFYPIIPNIVNTLSTEFAKRDARVNFRAVDEYTYNEILEQKRGEIENVLVKQAEQKMLNKMLEQGGDPNDPEMQKMMEQEMSMDNLKTLPEIEKFFTKDYEIIAEKWASKQHIIDEARFNLPELEETAFRDKLITDREFWHFEMGEDDYRINLWNPVLTFYHKSLSQKYISNSNFVGNVEVLTIPDTIDKYGWKMNEEQLLSLEHLLGDHHHSPTYALGGQQNDGSFYDSSKSHDWNTGSPSLQYREMIAGNDFVHSGNDIIASIMGQSEDDFFFGRLNMLRITTSYWKSQRKIGHLTKISEAGEVTTQIITEEYVITDTPIYNTTLMQNKSAQNLIFGEHIEWVWINQTYGGLKIGPNAPTMYGVHNSDGIDPIYLGINQNAIKPLKFQFKGDHTLYGCKLPVEGRIFSDRNTKSTSLVDSMKPFQIGYNIVNNQISDILIDEIGTVLLLDQNALPQHSLGEDWGKGNLAKAYVAMKDFSMLPLDTSIANTENALNFQDFQQLDLSQTQRLMSRIQLAGFFKAQAFEQIGLSPQRMGQQLGGTTSATEVEQIQTGSFAQTERHFSDHSDYLMPRVHQMRTDLAQWYHSNKSSVRLQHMTSLDERVNFEINGKDLMMRDINVYCSTNANHRQILEQMKMMALNNNTTGASIYDLGELMQTDSIGSLSSTLKGIEEKAKAQHARDQQHEQEMLETQGQQALQEKAMAQDHEALEAEKERRKDILVAEIKASGYMGMQDLNENKQSDFLDHMNALKKSEEFQENIEVQKDKVNNSQAQHVDKVNIKREEMNLKRDMKNTDLAIAKENKNQYDVGKAKSKAKPEKKKKKS